MAKRETVSDFDYDKTMELGRRLLDKHGLSDWRFDISNLHNTSMYGEECEREGWVGLCIREKRTIYVDWHQRQCSVRQTILHEIAHALTPDDNEHGKQWQEKAGSIGCTFGHLTALLRTVTSRT